MSANDLHVPSSCRVYTPVELATAMVDACLEGDNQVWLEPSFGRGVFLRAIADRGVDRRKIFAVELEDDRPPEAKLCNAYVGVEALSWLKKTRRQFDVVVGNPPYASLSSVSEDIRLAAKAISLPGELVALPGTANLWIAFVYAALSRLAPGGTLCFVLPAAFEHATYGNELRTKLPQLFGEVKVFRSVRSLFPGVQEGCVVLLAKKFGSNCDRITRVVCSNLSDLVNALYGATPLNIKDHRYDVSTRGTLGDVASVRLGGVTGDVGYFLLNESRRCALGLPTDALVPVLSRARHLLSATIGKGHWKKLCERDEPVWLFRPVGAVVSRKSVRSYLEFGLSGGCKIGGYKIRERDPWFETPLPGRVDAVISGLSSGAPRMSLLSWRGLSATNTLYTLEFAKCLDANARYAVACSFFTTAVRGQLERRRRIYASGLKKLEPSDLLSVAIPAPLGTVDYRAAYQRLFNLPDDEASRLADSIYRLKGDGGS